MTAITAETRAEIESLERKHAENPEGRYFVPLANAYRKAGEVGRAIEILRRGLEKHPGYVSAHIMLGRCFRDEGNLEAAGAEFQQVLSLDPQNLVALRTLGELAAANGNVAEARRWYGELLRVDPMNEEARQALEVLGPEEPVAAAEQGSVETAAVAADAEPAEASADETPAPEPASAARPSRGEERHGFGGSQPEFPVYSGGESVVTETIAELYTRQGFYDRAIEVYRELIRRRGEDPRLRERLERVQRLADGEAEEPSVPAAKAAAPPPAVDSAAVAAAPDGPPDPFADSFLDGFPDDVAARRVEGRTTSLLDVVEEPVTIRSFLQEILSWTPGRSMVAGGISFVSGADEEGGEPAVGTEDAEFGTGAASDVEVSWETSAEGSDASADARLADAEVSELDSAADVSPVASGEEAWVGEPFGFDGPYREAEIAFEIPVEPEMSPSTEERDAESLSLSVDELAVSVDESAAAADEPAYASGTWAYAGDPPALEVDAQVAAAEEATASAEELVGTEEVSSFATEEPLPVAELAAPVAEASAFAADLPADLTSSLADTEADAESQPATPAGEASAPAADATVDLDAPQTEQPSDVSPIVGIPDDDLFPWEIPWEEEEASRSTALPVIDSVSPDPQVPLGGGEISPPGTTGWQDPPARESSPESSTGDGSSAHAVSDAGGSAESRSDDDDDLESFQAWLRSLKR